MPRPHLILLGFALVVTMLAGCGKPQMVSVKGTVKLDGKPVEHCKVGLFPDLSDPSQFNPEKHGFGYGMTDKNGQFEIQHPQGEKGIWPGSYKVTFVAWVDSKGKPISPTDKPSEVPGGVKNLVPVIYEQLSTTPETVSVPGNGLTKEFNLSSK
jgi:hypothetical protein